MVSREGLEPSTPGLKGPCSNQLSYRPKLLKSFFFTECFRLVISPTEARLLDERGRKIAEMEHSVKETGGRYRTRTYDLFYVKETL